MTTNLGDILMKSKLEVILEFIPKLFWPLIIVFLIVYIIRQSKKSDQFRSFFIELAQILKRTKSFNAGSFSIEFQETMKEVSSELKESEIVGSQKKNSTEICQNDELDITESHQSDDARDKSNVEKNLKTHIEKNANKLNNPTELMHYITKSNPNDVILNSWTSVEKSLLRFFPLINSDLPRVRSIEIIRKLISENFLPKSAYNIYRQLFQTRNEVVHYNKTIITLEDSIDYYENCSRFIEMLDQAYAEFIRINPQSTQENP